MQIAIEADRMDARRWVSILSFCYRRSAYQLFRLPTTDEAGKLCELVVISLAKVTVLLLEPIGPSLAQSLVRLVLASAENMRYSLKAVLGRCTSMQHFRGESPVHLSSDTLRDDSITISNIAVSALAFVRNSTR